ncbi:lysylphosphatidylglycerol synthase domain-containing protein [Luteimonas sp. R10]|uniref:lysylphosphatidylglycerol synthase domain-containing protein n=1 Tax=Luteimonas sp. R10 TaxID=3108176 RepID=UPI00308BAF62|nr:lysylphosphatidylglycerol synthase domain-containing protein [Luteimonas sp. R10]
MSRADRKPRGALRRGLTRAFPFVLLAIVAVALFRYAGTVDWPSVGEALKGYPATLLWSAAGLAVASYLLYCGYDLAARRYAGHALSTPRVLTAAFVSYAFNLNLGALIGGVGFRFRMYLRAGIGAGVITRIVAFSIVANWLGYVALAGLLLVLAPEPLAGVAGLRASYLSAAGVAALALVVAYLLACAALRGRVLRIRGHEYRLPSPALALLQLALSSLNWLTIATILFVLLGRDVAYPVVLGALLAGAVFAALVHIPAGLGALEAAFFTLLGGHAEQPQLIAALLAYRSIYYIAPLLLAILAYLGLEARGAERRGHRDST